MSALFLWYFTVGILCVFGASLAHLIIAERKGYAALDWWKIHGDEFYYQFKSRTHMILSMILGLMIWPIRIIYFTIYETPELYEKYGLK